MKRKKRSRKDMNYSDDSDDDQHDLTIKKLKVAERDHGRNNNFQEIPSHPYRTLFIGKTGSGKTMVMVNLLTRNRMLQNFFDEMYLFSPQIHVEKIFGEIDKQNKKTRIYKFDKFETGKVSRLVKSLTQRAKAIENELGNRGQYPRILFFVDDFASKKHVMKGELLEDIFFTTRKYSITTFISTQRWNKTPPALRDNAEFFCIWEQNWKNTKALSEEISTGKYNEAFLQHVMMNLVAKKKFSFLFFNRNKVPGEGRFSFGFGNHLLISQSDSEEDSDDQDGSQDDSQDKSQDDAVSDITQKRVADV